MLGSGTELPWRTQRGVRFCSIGWLIYIQAEESYMWTCISMRRWPLGIYTHVKTFEIRMHPRSAWSFEAKVCVGTYKMHFVNAWLWYNYCIANCSIVKMIKLLEVMISFHELLWIQGNELCGKGSHVWLNTLLKVQIFMEHYCEIMSVGSMLFLHK